MSSDNKPPMFLVYSNQHRSWWASNKRGYTQTIEEAGRYPHDDAIAIVRAATLNWELKHEYPNPLTGETIVSYDEVMVLAPEDTEVAW